MTYFKAADKVKPLDKHRAFIKLSVVIGVFKDHNAVVGVLGCPFARIAKGLGNPEPATIVNRHGNGLMNIRLPGKKGNIEPFRNRHGFGGFGGIKPGVLMAVGGQRANALGEGWLGFMKKKVIEIDMTPWPVVTIDDFDSDLFPHLFGEVQTKPGQCFGFHAVGLDQNLARGYLKDLNHGKVAGSARHQKTSPRVGYFERDRGKNAGGEVIGFFVGPNPIFALVVRFHVSPTTGNRVPFDGLAFESVALGHPIAQVALFKI